MNLPAILFITIIIFAAWASYAFPGIISLTASALEACQSLLVRCLELADISKLFFIWSGAALISAGLIYAAFRAAMNIMKARRAIATFPTKSRGDIALIMDDKLKTAFTCGFLRPKIYISTGLLKGLEKDELRAVFLHELRHKKGHDPLRFLMYGFARDAFFYIPIMKYLAGSARLKKEHEADDAASVKLGGPLSVASALIKVARHASYGAAMAGEKEEVTGRVRRLMEGRSHSLKAPLRAIALSIVFSFALLFSLSMPIYAGNTHECTMERCEMHVDMVEGCRTHCSAGHGHHH